MAGGLGGNSGFGRNPGLGGTAPTTAGTPFSTDDRTIQKKTQNPGPAASTPAPAPPPPPVSTADRIRLLQTKLNQMGAGLVVDGVIGPKTQAAMRQYGLDVNGNPVAPTPAPGTPAPAGGGTPTPAPAATSAQTQQQIDDQIRTQYGYLGTLLLDNPEIHDVLLKAVQGGWAEAQVTGALMNTNYWKTTSDATRQWAELNGTDPATAQARVQTQEATIDAKAKSLGITVAPDRLAQMATDSLKFGWGTDQIDQAIGNEYHYTPGPQTGALGRQDLNLKQMAANYFVPLSDQTIADWETQIAKNPNLSATDFQNQIVGLAQNAYKAPWIQQGLAQGQTMTQITDPYRQKAATELGIDPNAVDFTQPKWGVALTQADAQGNQTGMDLNTFTKYVRSDPQFGWKYTDQGRAAESDFALQLAQAMGRAPR